MKIDIKKAQEVMDEFDLNIKGQFRHITYKEKIEKAKKELYETDPTQITKWGWAVWDKLLGGIYGGKIYAIGADSGHGKSTFINQIVLNLSSQNVKVTKYSLEDRLEDIGKEELFYISNRLLKAKGEKGFEWTSFNNGEYTHKKGKFYNKQNLDIINQAQKNLEKLLITELEKSKKVSIENLIELMEEEVKTGTRVFIIDHLHYFEHKSENRIDIQIENAMHSINEIARKYNVAVFLVAHYKKLDGKDPNNDSFKDASAVKQVSNIIIHLIRRFDTNKTEFRIDKIRGPIQKKNIEAEFDLKTFSYTNFIYL